MKASRQQLTAAILVLLVLLAASGYEFYLTHRALTDARSQVLVLQNELAYASTTADTLNQSLISAQAQNDSFESEISQISGTVNTLNTLSKTDPQLLAKYSKVYFLNENYVPVSLSPIPSEDTYPDQKDYEFLTPVLPHLEDLIAAASSSGLNLEVISAYRSFGTQAALRSSYDVTYGTGTNSFSAEQGYSEHQLGTAVDFTTPTVGTTFTGFENTDEYTWLVDNAYKYGFILSYPSGNTYYIYEPWHWRYVGLKLANYLHDSNQYFYDLDQRTINNYLVDFFN